MAAGSREATTVCWICAGRSATNRKLNDELLGLTFCTVHRTAAPVGGFCSNVFRSKRRTWWREEDGKTWRQITRPAMNGQLLRMLSQLKAMEKDTQAGLDHSRASFDNSIATCLIFNLWPNWSLFNLFLNSLNFVFFYSHSLVLPTNDSRMPNTLAFS